MKKQVRSIKVWSTIVLAVLCTSSIKAQLNADKGAVVSACQNYLEGFYQGDTTKIIASMKPTLHKFGYWQDKNSKEFSDPIYMTYRGAIAYAAEVLKKKDFPSPDAPMGIEILDMMDHIASAKVTAWWGYDYILLSKDGDRWMIEQVLWQGPLNN